MPNNQRGFDLNALKTDPKMWMRLAMPSKNGKYLENVFKDKENPFEKNYQAAVETLEKLAAEGKLYLREFGRSRHFHKVEKSDDGLKLGAQHEIKLSNSTADFGLSALMRMSRAYFKWIGLDGISNWFDGRLKRQSEIKELNNRYKEEYKSFTKEEKKELKALRKREENLKKLDEAKVRANASKKNLDAIRGKETTETLEELEAMLAKADQRAADNQTPEKQFARRALLDHEENLQKVGEARNNANEKKKTLDALRGKETTETLGQLEQMLSDANQIEQRRGGPLSANERKARKALRDYVKSLRELEKTEKKAEGTKKKLDETLGRETTETVEQLWEMLSISPEEVNERRALREHVKNLRKLAEAEKKAGVTQQKLDEVQSKNNPKDPKELDSPLSKAPNIEDKTNTMQPTYLGDRPVQNQIPVPPKQEDNLEQETAPQEIPGTKKEENEQGENIKENKIIINGVELTDETINQFPPHVVEAFRVIQQMIIEQEAALRMNQQVQAPAQPEVNQEEQAITDVEQPTNLQGVDDPEMNQNEPVVNINQEEDVIPQVNVQDQENQEINPEEQQIYQNQADDVYLTVNTPNVEEREMTQEELEEMFNQIPEMTQDELEKMFDGADAPTVDNTLFDQEIDAPLTHGADLEPNQVNMQKHHENQAPLTLQERLAAERAAMESVQNWRGSLERTLFSQEQDNVLNEYYGTIKEGPEGPNFLAGAVCGLLSAGDDPERSKQVMDALIGGKPLGNEFNQRINDGVTAYNRAVEQMALGNNKPMHKLITDSALALGRQAGQETSLSPRNVMIGRMISDVMTLADRHNLDLKLNDDQWAIIRGAFELSTLAQKQYDARQKLGQGNVDLADVECRKSVRDLLLSNAVEQMIWVDKGLGQEVTDTQRLMGGRYMTVENLTKMMSATTIRATITVDDVNKLLENPKSFESGKIGIKLGDELLAIANNGYDRFQQAHQLDIQREIENGAEQQLSPERQGAPV